MSQHSPQSLSLLQNKLPVFITSVKAESSDSVETEDRTFKEKNCLPSLKEQAEATKCRCGSQIKPIEDVAKVIGEGGYTKPEMTLVQMRQSPNEQMVLVGHRKGIP